MVVGEGLHKEGGGGGGGVDCNSREQSPISRHTHRSLSALWFYD